MAFLFQKFQEAVKTLAKNPMFARNPRKLQFEVDVNRLFMFTSYNRLGADAEEADIEEIIEMAGKASVDDQQKQVQENVHSQIKSICSIMDEALLPDVGGTTTEVNGQSASAHRSGLSFAVGRIGPPKQPAIPETKPLKSADLSQWLKDRNGYTVTIKPSLIPHKEAGQGLFIDGKAEVGSVVAIYPGVIYSPAYYRYIPGYPRVDAQNPYLITRYDGTVINAQPWGVGGETRQVWTGHSLTDARLNVPGNLEASDRIWRLLSKPLEGTPGAISNNVLERRNPLAKAHFTNHPAKEVIPNVMICPYDFPLTEKEMRPYIPNILFGPEEEANMKRYGTFWFKLGSSRNNGQVSPVMKTMVLVATRALCDEELLLNYRLSNSKRRPAWYTPVDEEEDRRRWS
ncbi:hypothetical protein MLD38_011302 [Melastoma candidum]|uniref:Uncharacterized protein n=1 Tax=Melastoma candidum TaxID=119954 RepID=A0ACB9R6R3_9MYRT|nr:hypothetical protein MLD38_011302 [Melastoma candidum]